MRAEVLLGDARDVLATLSDASVDAIVTDPPAGIGFMGKKWDTPGALVERKADTTVAWDRLGGNHHPCSASDRGRTARSEGAKFRAALTPIFAECVRVLKPGHQALVWALPRTSHWTATALEDAGFYVADVVTHHFGSGFPKSRSLLKPASEHWILCRAPGPLQPLQIDACRVATDARPLIAGTPKNGAYAGVFREGSTHAGETSQGRWPPNTLLSHHPECQPTGVRRVRGSNVPGPAERGPGYHRGSIVKQPATTYADAEGYESVDAWTCVDGCPVAELDRQAGNCPSKAGGSSPKSGFWGQAGGCAGVRRDDTGGPSRFFPTFGPDPEDAVPFRYQPKASRAERNAGLDGLPEQHSHSTNKTTVMQCACGNKTLGRTWPRCPRCGADMRRGTSVERDGLRAANHHPTVKPTALMAWLCKLVTPEGGVVLDCFAGSGSTGVACVREGFGFIGIEMSEEYAAIARARIAHEQEQRTGPLFAGVGTAGAAR